MNTFKRKSLYAALAGVSALGAAGTADAVLVNPDGLGQVLIYPYYTVRSDNAGNAFTTLLSVVNTTASAKAVKVRFLEGMNSQEVLDFNLFLSPYDVWTAALSASTSGGTQLVTGDKSCTLPNITGPVEFKNTLFTDGGPKGLDRTREGYFEIIEMGPVIGTTATNVTHVSGVPPGCAKLTDSQASTDTQIPTGGLMGALSLVNVAEGNIFAGDPTVLDAFHAGSKNYGSAGTINPDLTTVFPKTSVVFYNGAALGTNWTGSTTLVDAVSAVLMHDNILNEWTTNTAMLAATDWIVTMPTKRYYVAPGSGPAIPPFQNNFDYPNGGSCDNVTLNIFDREERTTSTPLDFSPPSPTPTNSLCWEANVVTFAAKKTSPLTSNVFGSINAASVPVPAAFPVAEGWLKLGFPVAGATHTLTSPGGTTYLGLPTIGFAAEEFLFVGATSQNFVAAYGSNWGHKYTRTITGTGQ